ncbi:glycosyltransferase family 2 protein [Christiangramia salexigens]|uniref:dTDP-Rha--alpha-D-GlcNAc-pyrophosphate polyprenol alpha-3-L-rhamnosyltransferase n=1 Tax=Christiangramia salexigens TaxID=1913577 RepID=A0A1L3J4F7_9FLAO|nr:glycosyltransferase [Christiangramia salexigens]APG60015.1 dTDP-Rha--alpha-D-GlcNAc-pyrophosphate polyprenol alpha-3-L-rhamnosyltransferase [Christiangramia salexigens]
MKVAVVILNWNGRDLLAQFLPSVIQHSADANIYIADNASTDDSVDFVKNEFPSVQIIRNDSNAGYAGGYNLALKELEEDIFVLLNSDVEVTENWLVPIKDIFRHEPGVAAVQPKILDFKRKEYFEYAGAAGGFIDRFGYPFCRGRIFQHLEKDNNQFNDDYIFWASGACLAVRKDAFNEVGKLDEDFFAHQEEIDLCWRLQNAGYRVKYTGKSTVYHVGGATLKELNPRKTFLNFRNSLFMLLKNIDSPKVYLILLFRMVLDGFAALKFLIEGNPLHFAAIFKAHLSFYKHFFRIYKKRKKPYKIRQYYKIDSVVYAHFIQRKNEYHELKK